jgi:hypothetical protein
MPPEDEIRPNSDFSALLRAFNDANVDDLLIGGLGVASYFAPPAAFAMSASLTGVPLLPHAPRM